MDLTTNYLGLRLKNPIVAGASPLSRDLGTVRALEDSGAAAIVLYSLFQEQITHDVSAHDHFQEFATESYAEALTHVPSTIPFPRGPDEYLDHLAQAKRAVDLPVIASLNGTTLGGWTDYARRLEQAGADGIELNIYQLAADPTVDARGVENRYLEVLEAVKKTVGIPVALKIGPFFSALANFAVRLDKSGVDGLVLFNRFYQPDIDLEALQVVPNLAFSARHELRLPLRWIAILDPLVDASLAATTGVYTAADVLKLLMAGADVAMLCAVLLQQGPRCIAEILRQLSEWMDEHEYVSINQMQGSMNYHAVGDPGAFERANYMQALVSYA